MNLGEVIVLTEEREKSHQRQLLSISDRQLHVDALKSQKRGVKRVTQCNAAFKAEKASLLFSFALSTRSGPGPRECS